MTDLRKETFMNTNLDTQDELAAKPEELKTENVLPGKVWLWKPGDTDEPANWYLIQKPSRKYDYYLYVDTDDFYCLERLAGVGVVLDIRGSFSNSVCPDHRFVFCRVVKEHRRRTVSVFSQLPMWFSYLGLDQYWDCCMGLHYLMHFEDRPLEEGGTGRSWNGYHECWAYREPSLEISGLNQILANLEKGLDCFNQSCTNLYHAKKAHLTDQQKKNIRKAGDYLSENINLYRERIKEIKCTKEGMVLPESEQKYRSTTAMLDDFIIAYNNISDYICMLERQLLH